MRVQLIVTPPFGPEIVSTPQDITESEYANMVSLLEARSEYDYFSVNTDNGVVYLRTDVANNSIYRLIILDEETSA